MWDDPQLEKPRENLFEKHKHIFDKYRNEEHGKTRNKFRLRNKTSFMATISRLAREKTMSPRDSPPPVGQYEAKMTSTSTNWRRETNLKF